MSVNVSRAIFFLLGLIVGAGLAVWYFAAPHAEPGAHAAASSTPPYGNPSGDVSVADQPSGSTVTVAWVNVPPPGVWVAVREVNEDGTLGNVLGAERAGGPKSNVVVHLLRDTIANGEYAVELYRDDGDNQFEVGQDSVYVDFDTGEAVVAYFHTT